jgi:hypothetical protein
MIGFNEEFADKQIVEDLIAEFKELKRENVKLLKQIRVNRANHFLLEMEVNTLKDDLNNLLKENENE